MPHNHNNDNIYLPIALGLLFFLVAAAISWVTLPAAKRGIVEEVKAGEVPVMEEAATAEEEATNTEEAAPAVEVDLDSVIATINKGTCFACHTIPNIPNAMGQVGPDLSNIGVDGATRIDGYTAEDYIRESLRDPAAFTAPVCPAGPCVAGAMPPLALDDAEIESIVSYLVTLGVETE